MARGDRTFTMLLEVRNGRLEENLTVEEEDQNGNKNKIKHQKLHKRQTKIDFRDLMKDPSKFATTELAQPDHPTIIMREAPGGGVHDEVTFYYFEAFTVLFDQHPDVIEESETSPDGPFTSGGNVVTNQQAADSGQAGATRFSAGPYRVAGNAKNQRFWKFTVVTAGGLTLDPCIIIEP